MADDQSYYERRAEIELEMAQRAKHPEAVRAHCGLADLYLERVYGSTIAPFSRPEGALVQARLLSSR
jgi:hypothetical protein